MPESLIFFKELSTEQIDDIYDQFRENFADKAEYDEFISHQSRLYSNGIKYQDFVNNIANFSMYNLMNSLRNKLGNDAIKEHMTDDGSVFYSLGDVPKIEGLT